MKTNPSTLSTVAIVGDYCNAAFYNNNKIITKQLGNTLSNNFQIITYTNKSNGSYLHPAQHNGKQIKIPLSNKGIQALLTQFIAVIHASIYADTLIFIGVSGCIWLPIIHFLLRKKTIVHMVQPIEQFAYKRVREQVFQQICLFIAAKLATQIVVADTAMQHYMATKYHVNCQLVAYGGNHVQTPTISSNCAKKYPFLFGKYAYASINLLDKTATLALLEAFEQFTDYPLAVAAPWNSTKFGRILKAKYQHCASVYLLDTHNDKPFLHTIQANCCVYLHSHQAAGTSLPLMEAMYLGLPVFCFNNYYLKCLTNNAALYFSNRTELLTLLSQTTLLQLDACKKNLLQIANKRFTWQQSGLQYIQIMNELQHHLVTQTKNGHYKQPLLVQLKAAHLNSTPIFSK